MTRRSRIPGALRARAAFIARDETGSLMASMAFVLIAAVLVLSIVAVSLTNLSAASAARAGTSIDTSIDTRLSTYVAEVNAKKTPNLAAICYPTLETCVSITSVRNTAGARTVTLTADYRTGENIQKRVKTVPKTGGTHILSFDATGAPVWGSTPTN